MRIVETCWGGVTRKDKDLVGGNRAVGTQNCLVIESTQGAIGRSRSESAANLSVRGGALTDQGETLGIYKLAFQGYERNRSAIFAET